MDSTRKVACIDAGNMGPEWVRCLRDAGWEPIAVDSRHPIDRQAYEDGCRVGIACLPVSDDDALAALELAVPRLRHLELIAVVPPGAMTSDRIREFVAVHCIDYHTTPLDMEHLAFTLGHADGMARLMHRARNLQLPDAPGERLVGASPVMRSIHRDIAMVSHSDAPVVITGESGTGKELVARAIHRESRRRDRPFVAVNCMALPPTLIHAELFGFEKGAFTGAARRKIGHIEAAEAGTIFLDEIGDLDFEIQALLLRFLEEGTIRRIGGLDPVPVDVRVLAATHVDLERAVREGRFREDLYYRLNVLRINMPPLRERGEDIEALASHFLRRFAGERHGRLRGFSPASLRAMRSHGWPGNVRELMNRIRRAVIMSDGPLVTPASLRLVGLNAPSTVHSLEEARGNAERQSVVAALEAADFSPSRAARVLGVSRATFYRLVAKHGVDVEATGTHPAIDPSTSAVGDTRPANVGGDSH